MIEAYDLCSILHLRIDIVSRRCHSERLLNCLCLAHVMMGIHDVFIRRERSLLFVHLLVTHVF